MGIPVRVLAVEDSPDDAELLILALKAGGYDVFFERVQTAQEVSHALGAKQWDIILSDFAMPSFNALDALSILKQTKLDIPFIVVSGTVGEETAVKAMKAGAQDYLMKDKLMRLIPAVQRELKDAADRRKQREIEAELNEQLRQSQKLEAIGSLAGGIAHDFNNMLGAILMHCDTAFDEIGVKADPSHDIAQIQKAAEHAALLTRQLLIFSRKQPLELRVLNINDIVSEVDKMAQRVIGENIKCLVQLDQSVKSVRADSTQLTQLVMNLMVNARDAMPKGGELRIETRMVFLEVPRIAENGQIKPGEYAVFTIQDTGCGMDEKTRARIFEPFFTTKEFGKGTGLGLSTVYGVVEQSSGFITLESKIGVGTKFEVYLPVVDLPRDMPSKEKGIPANLDGQETILVAEDQDALRKVICSVLEKKGYKVLQAKNGQEALSIIKECHEPVHLIITDVMMPEMGGADLANAILAKEKDTKIIFISGYLDDTMAKHGLSPSKSRYLEKPFSSLELLQKVRNILSG